MTEFKTEKEKNEWCFSPVSIRYYIIIMVNILETYLKHYFT